MRSYPFHMTLSKASFCRCPDWIFVVTAFRAGPFEVNTFHSSAGSRVGSERPFGGNPSLYFGVCLNPRVCHLEMPLVCLGIGSLQPRTEVEGTVSLGCCNTLGIPFLCLGTAFQPVQGMGTLGVGHSHIYHTLSRGRHVVCVVSWVGPLPDFCPLMP